MSFGIPGAYYSKPSPGALPRWGSVLTRGLKALWMFNEGSGNRLEDISQNQVHGRLTSMDPPTDWKGSRYGYALDFDGSNDYVDLPDPGGKKLQVSAITLAVLVRLNATQTIREFITRAGSPTVSGWGFGIDDTTSNKIKWYTATSGGSAHNLVSNTALNNFEWYTIVATYFPATAGTNKYIYINGHVDASAATAVVLGYGASTVASGIATYRAAGTQFLNGQIALCGCWDYAMPESTVKHLHSMIFGAANRVRLYEVKAAAISYSGRGIYRGGIRGVYR